MKYLLLTFLVLFVFACKKDPPSNTVQNESRQYSVCNNRLSECVGGTGDYCLFGFKWGLGNPFNDAGYNGLGPKEAGGNITYSFQEENGLVNTHAQINLPSQSFSTIPACAKTEIRKALKDWESIANLTFEELADNSDSDIRFFVADIRQSGIGYPNYHSIPCDIIGGDIVIKRNVNISDCHTLYLFFLHEIGHTLGLGHVTSANVMNPDFDDFNLDGLQAGDKKGILEIYGEK